MHISFSYAKTLGETNFHTWEIPQSGSKAKDGEKRKRERERERAKVFFIIISARKWAFISQILIFFTDKKKGGILVYSVLHCDCHHIISIILS